MKIEVSLQDIMFTLLIVSAIVTVVLICMAGGYRDDHHTASLELVKAFKTSFAVTIIIGFFTATISDN